MWKDQLRPASFNGIEFFIEDHEYEIGHRLDVNEYPFRAVPFTDNLGRKAKKYNLTGYILGDDYIAQRDALLDAMEGNIFGTLVHPYYGSVEVCLESGRFRETKNEGGYVLFSCSFVERGQRVFPDPSPVPDDLVDLQADSLISAARANFIEEISVIGVSEWVRQSYSGIITQASEIFDTIQRNGGINNQITTDLINQAAEWAADLSDIVSPSSSLLLDVESMADKLISMTAGVFELAPSPDIAAGHLQRFNSFDVTTTGAVTAAGQVADSNSAATETFIKSISLANEAKATVDQSFTSYDQAIIKRNSLLTRIDEISGSTLDDVIYENMVSLRRKVAEAVPGEENSLPRLETIALKDSLPSLVVAYDLYGSVTRETDILTRNSVRHPGFMPGGQNLNVVKYVGNQT